MTEAADIKRLEATARAHEVFDAFTRIRSLENHVFQFVANHNPDGDNHERRDCGAFWSRLEELNLTQFAHHAAGKVVLEAKQKMGDAA